MNIIDAHTHLHDEDFNLDREEVLKRMEDLKVGAITVGTDLKKSKEATLLASSNQDIYATVGQHPTDTNEIFEIEEFEKLTLNPKVVAVGECGLDYSREISEEEKARQKKLFIDHLSLARKHDLPLMIHCRPYKKGEDAHEDMISILSKEREGWDSMRGSIHFFTGSKDLALRYIELGFAVSLSGVVTFAKELEEMVRALPKGSFLVETDAPYASPVPFRGKRNEPVFVLKTIEFLANIRGESAGDIALETLKTAQKIFKIA